MSCAVCESYVVQLRPAVDVLVVPYSVRVNLSELQNARCNDKDITVNI